jgi:hypothetical protein
VLGSAGADHFVWHFDLVYFFFALWIEVWRVTEDEVVLRQLLVIDALQDDTPQGFVNGPVFVAEPDEGGACVFVFELHEAQAFDTVHPRMVDHDLIRPRHEVANDVKAAIEICEDKQVFTFAPGKVVAPCSAIHDVVAG